MCGTRLCLTGSLPSSTSSILSNSPSILVWAMPLWFILSSMYGWHSLSRAKWHMNP